MELREEADGLRFKLAGVVAITRLAAAAWALAGVVEGKPILVTLWTGANRPYLGWHWKYLEGTTIKDRNKKRLNDKKEKTCNQKALLTLNLWLACCEFYQPAGVVHPACSVRWMCRLINTFSNVFKDTWGNNSVICRDGLTCLLLRFYVKRKSFLLSDKHTAEEFSSPVILLNKTLLNKGKKKSNKHLAGRFTQVKVEKCQLVSQLSDWLLETLWL